MSISKLHSRFDPAKEARRFLDREVGAHSVATAVLVAPGLNYLTPVLTEAHPGAKIVALFASEETFRAAVAHPILEWRPGLSLDPEAFLRRVLREEDVLSLRLLVWPPAEKLFPEATARLLEAAAGIVSGLSAGFATTAAAGPRWIRNAAFHAAALAGPRGRGEPRGREVLRRGPHPVVIAAAGPTLESSLGRLAARRSEIELWALPSAVLPLATRGVTPDLIVASDPGFYARCHLRRAYAKGLAVAAPATAARNLSRLAGPLSLFSNGTPMEEILFSRDEVPTVPENGSVAGTALDLALLLDRDPVVFVGLDGSSCDLRTHAGPSELDYYVIGRTSRLFPEETARLQRVRGNRRIEGLRPPRRVSPALAEYAKWFRRRCRRLGNRVGRVNPTAVDYGMTPTSLDAVPPLPVEMREQPVVYRSEDRANPASGEGFNKLVDELSSLSEGSLDSILREERELRHSGSPRSQVADLVFLAAARTYTKALLWPEGEHRSRLGSELQQLVARLRRYTAVSG